MNDNMIKRKATHSLFATVIKKRPTDGQIHHLDRGNLIGKVKPMRPAFDVYYNIMGSIREPLIMLDHDLRVAKANRYYYEKFNVKPKETEGQLLFDLGNRQWDTWTGTTVPDLIQD